MHTHRWVFQYKKWMFMRFLTGNLKCDGCGLIMYQDEVITLITIASQHKDLGLFSLRGNAPWDL